MSECSEGWSIRAIERTTTILGSVPAIGASVGLVLIWATVGLVAGVFTADPYQLVINTTTTIVTFLMVFIIQNSQNRSDRANQAKLDEILRAIEGADDKFRGIERLSEREIEAIRGS